MRIATWWMGTTVALIVGTLALVLLPVDAAHPTGPFATAPTTPVALGVVQYVPPIGAADIRLGPEDAKVTLIEYGDFQCSNCAHYAPIVRELQANYQDRVLFAYRFVPLDNTNGWMAAQSAYAAHLQGKFWQMYDLLYERRSSWQDSSTPLEVFTGYAEALGLRTADFVRDATSNSTLRFITDQKAESLDDGVAVTPTFFINGQPVPSGTYHEIAQVLDEALAHAD